MSLLTRYDGEIIIADSPENIVFGTVMLGNDFGTVISASVTREADVEELLAAGSLLACIMRNPKFKFKFKTMFSLDKEAPGLADLISFPFAGLQGRVLPPIQVDWEEKGHRQLSIEATSWDKLSANNDGGGAAYTFNGTVYTPMV